MTLSETTTPQLWRKAEADARDAVNYFTVPPDGDDAQQVHKILQKLRTATCAMQEIECRMRGRGAQR